MTRRLREARTVRKERAASSDGGYSLPELLVAIFLLSIVTAIMVSLLSSMSRSFTREEAATDSTNTASSGMNEMTRVIRSGTELRLSGGAAANVPVFSEATANAVTLYAFIDTNSANPRPMRVRFSIDAQRRLVETRWNATNTASPWAFATTPSSSRVIARQIPTGATAMFRYFTATGAELTPPSPGAFTETQRKSIAAVRIQLTVQADETGRAEPVELRNTVSIPNLGISRVGPTT